MQTSKVERITVSLPHEMMSCIKEKVQAGAYASTSDLIRDAMRLWQKNDLDHQLALQAIKGRLKHSVQSGAPIPMDKVFKKLQTQHRKKMGK